MVVNANKNYAYSHMVSFLMREFIFLYAYARTR